MKKTIFLILLFLYTSNNLFCQNISLMTYNIRLDTPRDSLNRWTHRKDFILSQINYYKPDIFGIQEGLKHQVDWLNKSLEYYNFVGVGRSDVKEKGDGEFSAIFYDTTKFNKIASNTFWLSKTPYKPSRGWDASLNRICTYVLLEEKQTENKIFCFNTHFDHKGKLARKKSVELILNKIQSLNKDNYPVVLMGDFNLTSDQFPIQTIRKIFNDSRDITVLPPFGPEGTFCSFDICKPVTNRIDYIFVSKEITVTDYAVFSDILNQRYPSDHFPVFINIILPGS